MKKTSKYLQSVKMGMQNAFQYRTNFLLSLVGIIVPAFIQFFLWKAIYGQSSDDVLYGYSYNQMLAYIVLSSLTSMLVRCGFEYDVYMDIKEGGLSKFIVQPVSYFKYRICCFWGEKTVTSVFMVVIIVAVVNIMKFHISPDRCLVYILSILFAILLNLFISFSVSTISFWVIEISYLFSVISMIVNLVSGGVFPLDIFGKVLCTIFKFLPFQYTIYFPVNVLNSKLNMSDCYLGLGIQLVWIVIMFIAARILWREGLKKFISVGG